MTPKELLYVQDALSHAQHMQLKSCNYAAQIKDPQLKAFVEQLSKKHQQHYDRLLQLL